MRWNSSLLEKGQGFPDKPSQALPQSIVPAFDMRGLGLPSFLADRRGGSKHPSLIGLPKVAVGRAVR